MSNNPPNVSALAYASLPNTLTLTDIQNNPNLSQFENTPLSTLTQHMQNTVLKRACCRYQGNPGTSSQSYTVNVKIPVPPNYQFTTANSPIEQKYGFVFKEVTIPSTMCANVPDHVNSKSVCDDFYALYCENSKNHYIKEATKLGSTPTMAEFMQYSPDCTCFIDKPPALASVPMPNAVTCWNNQCPSQGLSTDIYTPINARNYSCPSICAQILDIGNLTISGDASLKNTAIANCFSSNDSGEHSQGQSQGQSQGGSSNHIFIFIGIGIFILFIFIFIYLL